MPESVQREPKWSTAMPPMVEHSESPIRAMLYGMKPENEAYEVISLSIGDPTVFGNFSASSLARDAVIEVVILEKFLKRV